MKRLSVLWAAAALCIAPMAHAQLTMQMGNGWSLNFSGNVNAFFTYQFSNNSDDAAIDGGLVPVGQGAYARIRTGLLPAFAVFDVKGKEGSTDIGVHFGFAPQIQSPGTHDNFGNGTQAGAQIDMRQVYLTVGGSWGQILAGREIGLFQRQNILTDMTLFGTGAFGGSLGAGGTTLGRIGFGYIYPNFNAQITYSTPATNPWQWSIGVFDPSFIGSPDSLINFKYTPYPRVETEFTYTGKFHQNADKTMSDDVMLWVGGLWQMTYASPADSGLSVTSDGVDAGIKFDISQISLMGSGYYGQGLGSTLMLSTALSTDSAGNARKSYGYILQAVYKCDTKWSLGASWGQSILDATSTDVSDGANATLLKANSMATGAIIYQVTKSLKWVGEYDWTQSSNHFGGINRIHQATSGLMVFF